MIRSNDFIKKITITGFEEFFDVITDNTSQSGILRWQNDEELFAITDHTIENDKIKYSDCKEGLYYIINFQNLIKFDKIYSHNEVFLLSPSDLSKLKNIKNKGIMLEFEIIKVLIEYESFVPITLYKYLIDNFPINIYNNKVIDLTYREVAQIIYNFHINDNIKNDESIKDFVNNILLQLPYVNSIIFSQMNLK